MKKLIAFLLFVSLGFSSSAQKISGSATYKTASKMSMTLPDNIPPERKKMIEARMQKALQKEFTLEFNRNESLYKEEIPLDKEGNARGMRMMTMMTTGTGTMYKNQKEGRFVDETELFGKKFLVKDDLETYKWELQSETKTIGNYICNKAIAKREQKTLTIKTEDGEMKDSSGVDTSTIIAWYTMQLPISHGPSEYHGLPGLILEVNDGTNTILCTKVSLSTKEEKQIEEPTEGEEVTAEEFEEITEKKLQEMQRMFKNRGNDGRHGGNGFQITISR